MINWNWRHSRYQIENFIIKLNGVTPWGCFKQCMREMRARVPQLDDPDIKREFDLLYSLAVKCFNTLGCIDPKRIEELEADFWVQKFKLRIALDFVTMNRIAANTWETIISMPERASLFDFALEMTVPKAANYLAKAPNDWLNLKEDEIIHLEEGASWQKMISDVFGIAALITDDSQLETPNPKTQ